MRKAADYELDFRSEDGKAFSTSYHGVHWSEAPIPRRIHFCRPQTEGFINYFTLIQRCACGAISIDGRRWCGRNSRRRHASTSKKMTPM